MNTNAPDEAALGLLTQQPLKGTFLEKGFQQLLAAGQSEMDGKERAALRATGRKFYFTGKGTKDYSRQRCHGVLFQREL